MGPDGQDFGVVQAVTELAEEYNLTVFVTDVSMVRSKFSTDWGYPSWYLWK